jgi:hypothetical protein
MNTADALIKFTGVSFREQHVECPHCSWKGAAGSLIIPGMDALGESVSYACPQCTRFIARHEGLTKDELQSELEAIREILSGELRQTLPVHKDEQEEPEEAPTFSSVRELIRDIA